MIDELDDFNQQIRDIYILDHMKTIRNYMLVRSSWVMANKGDSEEPDAHAKLVKLRSK